MRKVIVCAVLMSVAAAWADEAEHAKLAEQALAAMDVQKTIEQSFEAAKRMQMAQLNNMNLSSADAEKTKKMQTEIMSLVKEEFSWDKVKDSYIKLYADVFTEDELKGLIEFYNSPAGRKFIEKMPELMQKSSMMTQKQMMGLMPKIKAISARYEDKLQSKPFGPVRAPLAPAPAPAPAASPAK